MPLNEADVRFFVFFFFSGTPALKCGVRLLHFFFSFSEDVSTQILENAVSHKYLSTQKQLYIYTYKYTVLSQYTCKDGVK